MVKRTLMFAFLVTALFFVSGRAEEAEEKEEDEKELITNIFTDEQLELAAKSFETEVIQPNNITCENSENYCKNSLELGNPDECIEILTIYLCDGKKDKEGIRKIMKALKSKLEAAEEAKTEKPN